jgi:hypothetical protein
MQPIVDGGLVEDPFLPEEPAELLRKGKPQNNEPPKGAINKGAIDRIFTLFRKRIHLSP